MTDGIDLRYGSVDGPVRLSLQRSSQFIVQYEYSENEDKKKCTLNLTCADFRGVYRAVLTLKVIRTARKKMCGLVWFD